MQMSLIKDSQFVSGDEIYGIEWMHAQAELSATTGNWQSLVLQLGIVVTPV